MTTPTPRTDAYAATCSSIEQCDLEFMQELERDLAARDAELAAMKEKLRLAFDEDLKLKQLTADVAEIRELKQRAEAAERELKRECGDTDTLLTALGLSPVAYRTEGGSFMVVKAADAIKEVRDEWKRKAEEAARDSGRYANPSDEAINASFAGLIEDQCVPLQIKRREEFKRRYLLVIAAIAAKGEA